MYTSLFHTLNISRQDMISRLVDLDVTSNNLANFNTAGYKASRSNFQEILQQQSKEGTQLVSTQMLNTQGAMRDSTNPYDLAIQGEGFFSVTMPDGKVGYTRDGQFGLDASNNLVSASGYPLVWSGKILPGMTNFAISPEGNATATDATGKNVVLGQVSLTIFPNPTALTNKGDNIWLESVPSGKAQVGIPGAQNFGTIASYRVEQSNIELSQEMTRVISLQRSFSMSLKAFQQTDNMISQAINMRKA